MCNDCATGQILVVDDSPTIRAFLSALLGQLGYQVEAASTANEALQLLRQRAFDLIIADKNLGERDGFEICRAAKQSLDTVACMLITADTSVTSAAQAVEEGIDAYLLKPLDRERVALRVQRAFEKVALVRQARQADKNLRSAKESLEQRSVDLQRTVEQLVATQHRLTESDKQASIGLLAAGVAHEINNPACFILPNLEYLKRSARKLGNFALQAGADTEAVEQEVDHNEQMVDRCLEGLSRISRVVQTMRLFSRRDKQAPATAVDLTALCRSLLDLITHELDGRAELVIELRKVPPVEGHKQQLAQVVLSLLLNARRSVLSAASDGPHQISLSTAVDESTVLLVVQDSGPPLEATVGADRALEPFLGGDLTSGPGLHLTLARDIIQRYQGELRLSASSSGNRLEARFPLK